MFSSCGSLETLDVSSLNTSNATDMESMFQWCNTLTSLNVSNLDTSKVTNMVSMFNSCKKIEELDLTSFKTSNVKSMAAMFTNCEELTTIKTTVDFVVDQVTDLTYNNLFEGNTKLVGGQGTTYDASKLKKEYARIDEGPTNPGYFTGTIPPTPSKKVSSFVVKANPSKTTYLSGDAFDPTGLVITVTYDDSTKADIDYDSHKSDFSFDPTTITASGDVVVTYGGKTATVAVTVNNPTPTPTPPGGGGTGGSSSGDSNPEKGPMGDLTKNPMYQQQLQNQQLNTTNNIPQTSLLTETALIST
jgi:surface protein